MKTTDPQETDDTEELREIAMYWLNKSYMLCIEKKALSSILEKHLVEVSLEEFIREINAAGSDLS